jgi:hypothetical protein
MRLTLRRQPPIGQATPGRLYVGLESTAGEMFECFTLEDLVRPMKVPGMTAMPAGTYEVIVDWSERFGRMMPRLLEVENFTGVRIHPGNDAHDTEGCILVGALWAGDSLRSSRSAFARLFPKIRAATRVEKCWIEVLDG